MILGLGLCYHNLYTVTSWFKERYKSKMDLIMSFVELESQINMIILKGLYEYGTNTLGSNHV